MVANVGAGHARANAQKKLALAAMWLGERQKPARVLESAIELEPGNSFALRGLGTLLVIAGPIRHAFEASMQRVVELGDQRDERTPCANTVCTRQQRLQVTDGLSPFLEKAWIARHCGGLMPSLLPVP